MFWPVPVRRRATLHPKAAAAEWLRSGSRRAEAKWLLGLERSGRAAGATTVWASATGSKSSGSSGSMGSRSSDSGTLICSLHDVQRIVLPARVSGTSNAALHPAQVIEIAMYPSVSGGSQRVGLRDKTTANGTTNHHRWRIAIPRITDSVATTAGCRNNVLNVTTEVM